MIFGSTTALLAILLMAFVENENSSIGVQIGLTVLYSGGLGFINQSCMIASQLILEVKAPKMLATSMALVRFLIQVGSTVGAAIFLSLMKAGVSTELDLLRETTPEIYQNIIASGTDKDYVNIGLVADDLTRNTLNSIYFKSISASLYVPIVASIIALLCSIFVTIPKVGEKNNTEETKS
jgi:hypothetical protein